MKQLKPLPLSKRAAVIVVNYNQQQEIGNFLREFGKHWPKSEAIVVDDGSSDDSGKVAEQLGYHVVRHERNRGVGAAIRTGIMWAQTEHYDVVAIMSSNGKMISGELSRVMAPVLSGEADYVTGNRFKAGGSSPGLSFFRKSAIPIVSFFLSLFLRRHFSDLTCGYRAYRIDFLFDTELDISQSWLDRYELEYYIHYWACRKRLRILEVPVSIRYDHLGPGRKSKIQPGIGWWSMLRPILLLAVGLKR